MRRKSVPVVPIGECNAGRCAELTRFTQLSEAGVISLDITPAEIMARCRNVEGCHAASLLPKEEPVTPFFHDSTPIA